MSQDPIGFAAGDANLYRYVGNSPTARVDPTGLDWLDEAANFAAGWGDTLSFGVTSAIRNAAGINGGIDHRSTAYIAGEVTGVLHSVAMGAGCGLKAAGRRAPGLEFSHWIPKRWEGPRSVLNRNYVSPVTHALSVPYRYGFMPRAWKAANPLRNALWRQWARVPKSLKGTGLGAAYGGASASSRGPNDDHAPNRNRESGPCR